jgi:prevent-host-death family protein
MDKVIQASEANRAFSRILREVGQGDSFTITSHGRAVARIVPADASDRDAARDRLLERLKKVQPMNAGPWKREDLYD